MITKYPPTQGGVAVRAWRMAHALARLGHEVDVVTNAREVRPPFGIFMREEDWGRCEGDYGDGKVRVHWTDPHDASYSFIPVGSPFVSKLASIALAAHRIKPFDVVLSVYVEPNAVAGHLVSQALGLPHVIKTAGSDVGRLWRQRQLEPLYDEIFRHAALVFASGAVADRLRALRTPRVEPDREIAIPDPEYLTDPEPFDLDQLERELEDQPKFEPRSVGRVRDGVPLIGVFGKLGPHKGTLELLEAVARLVREGRDVGVLVMGHPRPRSTFDFTVEVERLGLADRVLKLPFLPPWRVPSFSRRCALVCFLEQDFPIAHHAPIAPREALLAGNCVVASSEMIRKLPFSERMVDGFNCLVVPDVNDVPALADRLASGLAAVQGAKEVGRRGRAYALGVQQGSEFGKSLEAALLSVVAASDASNLRRELPKEDETRSMPAVVGDPIRLNRMRVAHQYGVFSNRLHALGIHPSPFSAAEFDDLWPRRVAGLLVEHLIRSGAHTPPKTGAETASGQTALVALPPTGPALALDYLAAQALELCDGSTSIAAIRDQIGPRSTLTIERLFERGAIDLSR
jgi:glycosyltransferase involved in cell wall biosynthesis